MFFMNQTNIFGNVWVAIIAGGRGTRLFPLSHNECPKQFCQLDSENTFIQATAKRFISIGVKPNRIVILTTNDNQTRLASEQLTSLGIITPNLYQIDECYGYAGAMIKVAEFIKQHDKNAIIINTPSDQYIVESPNFTETIKLAINDAANGQPTIIGVKVNDLVTFTGCGHALYDPEEPGDCKTVKGFVEKPDLKEAEVMMRRDDSACNTGINVWNVNTILKAAKKFDVENDQIPTDALMDSFTKLSLAIGKFDWYDCGTLKSLYDISKKTPNHKNATLGGGFVERKDCLRSLFYSVEGINLYADNVLDAAVVINIIKDRVFVAIVSMDKSQLVKQLANDYNQYALVLDYDFSVQARNNIIPYTNFSAEINVGFVGVHDYVVTAIKGKEGEINIIVSGKNKIRV
jgi:mannose-1-phosphate guanylyltransferase